MARFMAFFRSVILSEVGVREADAHGVEGPRVGLSWQGRFREFWPNRRQHRENASPRFRAASGHGVLRLRSCFAKRSSYSAQDDRVGNRVDDYPAPTFLLQ